MVLDEFFQLARHGSGIKLDLRPGEETPDDRLVEAVGNEAVDERRPIPACLRNAEQECDEKKKEKRPDFSMAPVNPFFCLPVGSYESRFQMVNGFRG